MKAPWVNFYKNTFPKIVLSSKQVYCRAWVVLENENSRMARPMKPETITYDFLTVYISGKWLNVRFNYIRTRRAFK